ncbi:hypothetical protein AMECASPLE_038375 [Ameca splendens]|uniref:Uncharacterized protein n=1 Tax=Ameca splendens TaxID=208324 RepID=A0ABV0YW79_9TELE
MTEVKLAVSASSFSEPGSHEALQLLPRSLTSANRREAEAVTLVHPLCLCPTPFAFTFLPYIEEEKTIQRQNKVKKKDGNKWAQGNPLGKKIQEEYIRGKNISVLKKIKDSRII